MLDAVWCRKSSRILTTKTPVRANIDATAAHEAVTPPLCASITFFGIARFGMQMTALDVNKRPRVPLHRRRDP